MAIIKIKNPAIDLDAAEIPNLPASKITSGTLDNARISLDAAEIPNLDTAKITTGTLADARIPANALNSNVSVPNQSAFKNIIINGDMSIAQRGTSQSSLSTGFNTVDRFEVLKSADSAFTESQSTDVPTGQGFANSWKIECTTADASLNATDYLLWRQPIEAQNLQYLKFGTASAESITLSFWIKSSKTGTYIISLRNNDNSRLIAQSYTISSAKTWEKKILTFAGDTSSGFNNYNGEGLRVQFQLLAGSNYSSGTLQTTWATYAHTNSAVGQINFADSTSNNLYITGVQLEAGTSASDFEFLPFDVNLQRCQRYLFTLTSPSGQGRFGSGGFINTTSADTIVSLPVEMRTTYSMSYSSLSHFRLTSHTAASALSSLALETSRVLNAADLRATASTAIGTAGNYALLYTNGSSSKMFFDAEL